MQAAFAQLAEESSPLPEWERIEGEGPIIARIFCARFKIPLLPERVLARFRKGKQNLESRAKKIARCNRTLTLILSLAGRGEEGAGILRRSGSE
jgi:hypothetical protein